MLFVRERQSERPRACRHATTAKCFNAARIRSRATWLCGRSRIGDLG